MAVSSPQFIFVAKCASFPVDAMCAHYWTRCDYSAPHDEHVPRSFDQRPGLPKVEGKSCSLTSKKKRALQATDNEIPGKLLLITWQHVGMVNDAMLLLGSK